MDKEFIQERIEALQSDNKLCFKQTNEIIEIAYRAAIDDISSEVGNKTVKNSDSQSKLKAALSKVEELELELEKANQLNQELKTKSVSKKFGTKTNPETKFTNKTIEEKYWVLTGKLDSLNKVFDWIYYDKKDLMTIYSELKNLISQLNDQKESISISRR